MAVETTNAFSGPFLPNGATTVFPFDFTAPSGNEVAVMLRSADGAESFPTDFEVTINPGFGGTVTFLNPPAAGPELFVLLDPDFRQQIGFENGSGWLAEPVNEIADRSASRDQVLRREVARSIMAPLGDGPMVLPPVSERAGKFMAFLPDGGVYGASGTGADGALRADMAQKFGAALSGWSQAEVEAVIRSVLAKLRDTISAADYGVTGDGVTDDTAALQAAIAIAAVRKKKLSISGTPRVTATITVPAFVKLDFDGAPGNFDGQKPASYIIKDASCVGPALLISGQAAEMVGGGVVAEAGNSGDNIQITGHSVSCINVYSEGAGQHNWRIGKDISGSPNANRFRLIGCAGFGAVANGLHVADNLTPDGAPNANSSLILGCMFQGNSGYGIYGGNSFGVKVDATLIQSNAGRGVYLDRQAQGWIISGGDAEHNEGGSGNVGADLYIADTDLACTFTDAGDLVTSAGHGFVNNNPIRFARVTTTTGIGTGTTYWVINATANTFQVSATKGGAAIALTGDGTGVVFLLTTHSTRGLHTIDGLHVGRQPYYGSLGAQAGQGAILGQGFGSASGGRPAYSEGSWVPQLRGGTTPGTLTAVSTGWVKKNGREVRAYFDIRVTGWTGQAGDFQIAGLPFSALSGFPATFEPSLIDWITLPANRPVVTVSIGGTVATMRAYGATSGLQSAVIVAESQTGNFLTNGRISGCFSYMTAD